jgi:small GTP-binding protein
LAIWKPLQKLWSARPWNNSNSNNSAEPESSATPDFTDTSADGPLGDTHLEQAAASLKQLLDDPRIPATVRTSLAADYEQLEAMCQKLQQGHLHIAAFGKVSAGKSSLLNALLGRHEFQVSALHGETKYSKISQWQHQEAELSGVHLIDTPGINEVEGEERERMAHAVAQRSDLILLVTDGDFTASEQQALQQLSQEQRPIIIVLNKCDRYSEQERLSLIAALQAKCHGLVKPENIVCAAADPRPEVVIRLDEHGQEQREQRQRPAQLDELNGRIWNILQQEGKTLAALNASLFAGRMSDDIAQQMAKTRRQLAEKVTRTYCLAKGLAVAVNPIPVADLLAAASLDFLLVRQLSAVYGLPMTRREPYELLLTITAQLVALMGAVWGINLVSSALKGVSAGLSTALTAGAQGALAWYATYLVGRATEAYLIAGKSWGDGGPKQVVQDIVNNLDRQSILAEAREEILQRLKINKGSAK